MHNLPMRGIIVIVMAVIAVLIHSAPVAGQFGRIGDAARRAQEELQRKRDAEEKAKAEAEAKAKAEADAKAKQEADAKKAQQPPPASAPAQPAPAAPPQTAAGGGPAAPSFKVYSNYDFVAGERIIASEDFTQDALGDFPARWNTNGAAEVVTIAGRKGAVVENHASRISYSRVCLRASR